MKVRFSIRFFCQVEYDLEHSCQRRSPHHLSWTGGPRVSDLRICLLSACDQGKFPHHGEWPSKDGRIHFSSLRGSFWNYWPPPLPERKRKIYSSTDPIVLRSSLWRLNPSSDCFNQDRKKGKKSIFERNLNVALTSSSSSLWVKTAIPLCASSQFWEQGRIAGG